MEQRKAHGHSVPNNGGAEVGTKQVSHGAGHAHPHRMQHHMEEEDEEEDEDDLDEDFLDSDGEPHPELLRHMRILRAQANSSELEDDEAEVN